MPYSSQVRVSTLSGTAPSGTVALTLWELFVTIDNSGRFRQQQVDQEQVSVQVGGLPVPFAFTSGPSFTSNNNHTISLAGYQAGRPGPVFRSGRLDTLPAGAPGNTAALVDVLYLDQVRFTMAEINAMIPTPITLPDGTVISTATLTSAPPSNVLTLTATGPYGATTYTYTLTLTIDPWDDEFDLSHVLAASAVGHGTIVFAANPGGGFQAFIDNLFAGLFVGRITDNVVGEITSRLNSAAAAAGASAAAAVGVTALPPGVVLGVRIVAIDSSGDLIMAPAIGCFGSLVDRFVAAAPPSSAGGRCFLATAACAPTDPRLVTLRRFRDEVLGQHAAGRTFVAGYEAVSPPLARVIASRPVLASITRALLVRPAHRLAGYWLRSNGGRQPD
jgi:hypothetical protein